MARAFGVLLFLVAGLTVLEAARDALLLTEMGPTALGAVYLAVAVLAVPAGAGVARVAARVGTRSALVVAIGAAAVAGLVFFVLPATAASAFCLYVVTALIGALVVPQFWALASQIFTVSQGRRLLAPVASAGMLGGVVGSSLAAVALTAFAVKSLLVLATGLFVLAGAAAGGAPMQETGAGATAAEQRLIPRDPRASFAAEPFLGRIALLVVLSTATLLVVDYLFKWTVAHTVPAAELGSFFARTYVVLNVLSLLVQLLVGAAVVKRLGVAAAVGVTPFLLLLGAGATLLAGGALVAVLVLKGFDGSLRHSIHRITTELLYFPLARTTRERVKPFIDGAAARAAQAAAATLLLGLSYAGVLTPTVLAGLAVLLAAAWLAVAASARRSYLVALRRTLAAGALDDEGAAPELDLASVEVLVERLASRDSTDVIAALRVLAARGRERLIPALVLYHPDEQVLVEALGIFAGSRRSDWLPLAERLLAHDKESVRAAVSRALARQGQAELVARLAGDPSPRLQAYATVFLALRESADGLRRHPALAALLEDDHATPEVLLGMFDAAADAPPTPRLADLTVELAARARTAGLAGEIDEAVARAATRQADPRLVPELLERLSRRVGREAVRQALVAIGKPAADAVAAALLATGLGRERRKHLPRTLARFGTQHAADLLVRTIERDPDGLVRFNALRGLGRIVAEGDVRTDRRHIERLAHRNLVEYLRLDGLRGAVGEPTDLSGRCGTSIGRLLTGLLEDKRAQALERTFRLLQIAHRREDLERVHHAVRAGDARARANAAEFLDTLLERPDQQPLRQLLRLAVDELAPLERLARASQLVALQVPAGRDEALLALMADADDTVASLASYYAGTLGDEELGAAAQRLYEERPTLEERALRLLEVPRAAARMTAAHA